MFPQALFGSSHPGRDRAAIPVCQTGSNSPGFNPGLLFRCIRLNPPRDYTPSYSPPIPLVFAGKRNATLISWKQSPIDAPLSLAQPYLSRVIDGGGVVGGTGGGTPAVQQSSCSNTHASPSLALSDRRQSSAAPVRLTRRDHLRASLVAFREISPPASSPPPDASH
jgi:hypothetical protein